MTKTINYKGWNPGVEKKGEFRLRLKYEECSQCGSIMWCRWGCTTITYPQGMRDFDHPRWTEVASDYLKAIKLDGFDTNDKYTKELIAELERRGC